MSRLIPAILLTVALAFAADVSGNWQFNVETNQGAGAPMVVLTQKGEQLTGTFHSQIFGDTKLTGTVKGNAIEFRFEGDAGGQTLKVAFKGTIESVTTMKGTAVYEGMDDRATWTATKK